MNPSGYASTSIAALGTVGVALHLLFVLRADPADAVSWLLPVHGALLLLMVLATAICRRSGPGTIRIALAFALVFRLAASAGEPLLSDDVFRYVWDGRVQLHGVHPYRHAPLDPELAGLRDDVVWPRINHPELRTIYPPVAQASFAALAALGLGPTGFRVVTGLLDFGVVLLLLAMLRRRGVPPQRLV